MHRMVVSCHEWCFSSATDSVSHRGSDVRMLRPRPGGRHAVIHCAGLPRLAHSGSIGCRDACLEPADATATAAHHWRVTVISPPVGPASTLTAVACPTSTWCAAVGWDGNQAPETGTQAYFTLAESRGRWSPGTAGLLPPGAAPAAVNGYGIACTGKAPALLSAFTAAGPAQPLSRSSNTESGNVPSGPACLETPPGRLIPCSMP
jgi:hypothetical protein